MVGVDDVPVFGVDDVPVFGVDYVPMVATDWRGCIFTFVWYGRLATC